MEGGVGEFLEGSPGLPSSDQLQASAVRFLIDGAEEDAASVLLACSLGVWESGDTWFVGDEVTHALHIKLTGPRAAFEILSNDSHPITMSIEAALRAVLPEWTYVKHFSVRADLIQLDPDWRTELLEIARGRGVHNQAATHAKALVWNNLRFRSRSEVKIAQALDRAGVLYFPNCRGRLTLESQRANREADFLICEKGKWGILEVDGEPFHPPSRASQDHERDRFFRSYGVRLVEHFDATDCFEDADSVVARFLKLLEVN